MNPNTTVTGVDLGSSSFKIASVLKGGVQVITNQANFRQTPNLVGLGQKERSVGESGQAKIKSNFSNSVTAPNRFLGFGSQNDYVQNELRLCPAKITKDENLNGLTFQLLYNQSRQSFTPEQLTAALLTEIEKIIAHTNKLSNKNMVISVPSYLTQHERSALADAVRIANKKVKSQYSVQLVDQEVAIAMDYGFAKRLEYSQKLQESKNILFIDVGHSKTNAFLASFNKQHMRVLTRKFHRQLGCKFIDQILLNFYAQKFHQQNPSVQSKILQDKKSTLKLLQSIEKQRKILSGIGQHDLSIECLLEDQDIFYTMKREEYQSICSPIIQRFKCLIKELSDELKEKGIQFDHIELIGGGSRIPFIINTIKEVFSHQPMRTLNSNECVARGAGLVSAMNSSIFRVSNYSSFSISPYSVNIIVNGIENQTKLIELNEILLKEKTINISIPETTIENDEFEIQAVYGNQREIEQGLYKNIFSIISKVKNNAPSASSSQEGGKSNSEEKKEDEKKENEKMEIQMKDENEMKSNSDDDDKQCKLQLTIQFDQFGRIIVKSLTSVDTQRFTVQVLSVNTFNKFTQTQLDKMEQMQQKMTLRDLSLKQFYESKNQYESSIYKNRDKMEAFISENSQFISPQKVANIRAFFEKQQNSLYEQTQSFDHKVFGEKIKQITTNVETEMKQMKALKQAHSKVQEELNTLEASLRNILQKYSKDQYPDEVSQAYDWVKTNQEKQKSSPKYNNPVVSQENVKEVSQTVSKAFERFKTHRQNSRQNLYNTDGFMMRQNHPYQTRNAGRRYQPQVPEQPSYMQRPRTSRNQNLRNNNPFTGNFFGNNGFFGNGGFGNEGFF